MAAATTAAGTATTAVTAAAAAGTAMATTAMATTAMAAVTAAGTATAATGQWWQSSEQIKDSFECVFPSPPLFEKSPGDLFFSPQHELGKQLTDSLA